MDLTQTLHSNVYLIFEICGIVSFIAILAREIYQKNEMRVFEILSALVFGLLLEIGNSHLGHTYTYSSGFAFQLFNVPIAIGIYWALIIYSVMLLSDQYHLPWTIRPFMDALTAITLDLYMDVVAVHLGLWTWVIPQNQEWYGIPFDNLAGWIFVVISFSFIIRFIRTLNLKRELSRILLILSPLLAYLGLMLLLSIYAFLSFLPYALNNWGQWGNNTYVQGVKILYNPEIQLWKIIIFVAMLVQLTNIVIGAMVKYRKKYVWRFDLLTFTILTSLHGFIYILLFTSGTYKEVPIFIFLGACFFIIYLLIHFLPHTLQKPKIYYFFKHVGKTLDKEERVMEKFLDHNLK